MGKKKIIPFQQCKGNEFKKERALWRSWRPARKQVMANCDQDSASVINGVQFVLIGAGLGVVALG